MTPILTSKQIRRKYRELVNRALERECKTFIDKIGALSEEEIPADENSAEYKEENGFAVRGPYTNHYHKIFSEVKDFDKHIARIYDGSNSLSYNIDRVFFLYREGVLTDDDINELGEEEVTRLRARKNLLDEINNNTSE